MTHSLFWSREFSGDDVLFVVGRNVKTRTAATQMIEVREMKRTSKGPLLRSFPNLHLKSFSQSQA